MSLAKGVVGAMHSLQQVTWLKADGTAQDLSNATITAKIRNPRTKESRSADGTFTVTDPSNGVFTWEYGTTDVADEGAFEVQFTATYTDGKSDKTFIEEWYVEPAIT